jgi:transposase
MRPFGSARQLEKRRRLAMEKLDEGLSLTEVARQIGCSPSSVVLWRDARKTFGKDGLNSKPVPGRPAKMKTRDKRMLPTLLLKGPMAHGYRTDLWTTARIAELILKRFGVKYHPDHIGRLMASLGWSRQKPERRPLERDKQAIERWKRRDWPRVKKTPHGWAPI